MTQEDKELLLKDLCARLPYGVVVSKKPINESFTWQELQDFQYGKIYKSYLRPMSNMTEEEKEEYCDLQDRFLCSAQYPVTDAYEIFDWLNKKMFDYRGLIPMGLAFEAPDGMYEKK